MQNTVRRPKILVSADGAGIVSHAGALLLTETARVTGLQAGLPAALGRWRAPRAIHDPGKIVLDLAVAVALGGDCLADIGVLRAEPGLFGPVASDPVVSRLVTQLAADAPAAMTAIGKARYVAGRWYPHPRVGQITDYACYVACSLATRGASGSSNPVRSYPAVGSAGIAFLSRTGCVIFV